MLGDQRNQASEVQPHRTAIAQPECLVLSRHRVRLAARESRADESLVAEASRDARANLRRWDATLIWVFMLVAVAQLIGIV